MSTTHAAPTPVKTNWSELKEKLRSKFTILTDADLNFEESQKDEMLGKIQKKVGMSKEQLAKVIS